MVGVALVGIVGFTFFCIECFLDDEVNRPIVTTHQYIDRNELNAVNFMKNTLLIV